MLRVFLKHPCGGGLLLVLAGLYVAAALPAAAAGNGDHKAKVPPSWQATTPDATTSDMGNILGDRPEHPAAPSQTPTPQSAPATERVQTPPAALRRRPWYQPRVSLGAGANLPEIFSIESHLLFGRYVGLRLFYAPALPLTVRVEMPADLIAVKSNVAIANPAYTINGKVTYGDHYGIEGLVFPFGGSFFLLGGVSHRKIRLVADAQSPLLICSGSQILQDSPCSDPHDSIQTQIQFNAHADVTTAATLLRAGTGWYWHIGTYGYFNFNMGAARPIAIHRDATLAADVIAPDGATAELNSALQQMRSSKLADLRQQTLQATKPVDQQLLPILGVSAGVRF